MKINEDSAIFKIVGVAPAPGDGMTIAGLPLGCMGVLVSGDGKERLVLKTSFGYVRLSDGTYDTTGNHLSVRRLLPTSAVTFIAK